MSKYNWTRQETKDLITLYEINECLWHKGLREYKDRDERISSIQSISDELKIPIEEINKKIHNLRNQYRFELNKTKKIIPGKPRYQSKWPYFKNLSFLENIVSVRGSNSATQNNSNNNNNNDHSNDEIKMEDQMDENYSDKYNSSEVMAATAVIMNGDESPQHVQQIQQIQLQQPKTQNVVISLEYDEVKPKILNPEASNASTLKSNKRKVKSAQSAQQQQLINQYVNFQQSQVVQSPKHIPIVIEDNSSCRIQTIPAIQNAQQQQQQLLNNSTKGDSMQSHDLSSDELMKNEGDEGTPCKRKQTTETDSADVFGMFVANEMRSLSSNSLKKRMKRQILQIILEINSLDSDGSADK